MSKTPNISVIVAAHNEEKYLGRAIRSLLNQDIDRDLFEIIVVDDGSTDRTQYALELFRGDIKIIKNETCKGLPYSLNVGIKGASGKYVVRMDADDYVHTSYLRILRDFLEQNKYMDAVACDYLLVNEKEDVLDRVNCLIHPIGCGIMFRMDQLVEIGLYDEKFLRHEDSDLRIRFQKKFKIHRVELPLYRYRKHDENMTLDQTAMDHFKGELTEKHRTEYSIRWSGRGHDYSDEEIQQVVDVMKFADPQTQGPHLNQFESNFSRYIGGPGRAYAVSSCAAALELAAIVSRVGPGDEVIMPAHTYVASAIPFARAGAKIVWADIDPDSLVVTAKTIGSLITSKTKAVLIVHLYGLCCDMDPILNLVKENDLILIEDVAQAIGATYKGKKAGSFGHLACFSFHGAKNMTTLGEGGVLLVNDKKFDAPIAGLRHNGMRAYPDPREFYWKPAMSDVDFDIPGFWPYNFSIGEAQCALGTRLLERIDVISEKKKERAMRVKGAMADFPELKFQISPAHCGHVYHLLPARFISRNRATRDDLMSLLFEKYKIKCVVQYNPLYRYPMMIKGGHGEARCPQTDQFFDHMISFPFHEGLQESDIDYLIESIRYALTELREKY